jgi:hypothetical protein
MVFCQSDISMIHNFSRFVLESLGLLAKSNWKILLLDNFYGQKFQKKFRIILEYIFSMPNVSDVTSPRWSSHAISMWMFAQISNSNPGFGHLYIISKFRCEFRNYGENATQTYLLCLERKQTCWYQTKPFEQKYWIRTWRIRGWICTI